jgi:xylulokinase
MYLGLDLGTRSLKALLINPAGATLATASAAYAVNAAQPGWSETHPEAWRSALRHAVAELPAERRREVKAVGCAGQMHGIVLCGSAGHVLRPAILWPDRRAQEQVLRYPEASEARVGNPITPGMAGPLLLWVKDNEPAVYAAARWALQPKDWLRHELCAERHTDASDATGTLLADLDGFWDEALIAELGLRQELLAPIRASDSVAGTLTKRSAELLSLPARIPVIVGAGDTAAALVGSGLASETEAQLTIGSGAQIVVPRRQRPVCTRSLNAYRGADVAGAPRWYVMAAIQNAGVALEWTRSMLGLTWAEAYAQAFAEERCAADDPIFLPYLTGERTPLMDPNVRGAWIGLSAEHDRAALMRAAFRGVAFGLRAGFEALVGSGVQINMIRIAGGGSLQHQWRDLLVRTLPRPLMAIAVPDASARGAALLAAGALERWTSQDLARMATVLKPLDGSRPDPMLEAQYARFRALYPCLRQAPLWNDSRKA